MGIAIGDVIIAAVFFVFGYFSKDWISVKLNGAKTEVENLEARIKAIVEAAKPKN